MARDLIPSDLTIKAIKPGDPRKRLNDGDGLHLLLFVKGGSHGWRRHMRFKEFAGYEWFSFTVDSFAVHILFSVSEAGPLLEGKSKSFELGGAYSAQLHQAHTSVRQTHIHVYAKNNQLFAMNQDGSAHDRSHGSQIPNKVAQAITQKFPGFNLPPDNFIESAPAEVLTAFGRQLLLG